MQVMHHLPLSYFSVHSQKKCCNDVDPPHTVSFVKLTSLTENYFNAGFPLESV